MKTCIIIAGPTAVGKTAVALDLARFYSTDIISADSRQCYSELNIGVAKPTPDQLAAVQHFFINSHSIFENVSAAGFEQYALLATEQIFQKQDLAIVVGGTGLYIEAFTNGLDDIPEIPLSVKQDIADQFMLGGMEWLQQRMQKEDPAYFATGEIHNPQRMLRALEVKMTSGKSIRDFQSRQKKARPFRTIKIGLELPREILYERINQRVDQMLQDGLVQEAEHLFAHRRLNALQTVGYKELFDYFEGKTDLARAVELVKQNTRRYAKRQMTWFKKDPEIKWIDLSVSPKVLDIIAKEVG